MMPYRAAPPPPASGIPWRRRLVDAFSLLRSRQRWRRWAGGRWCVVQRPERVEHWINDGWASGEWSAVTRCECSSPVYRNARPLPDEPHREACACEVHPTPRPMLALRGAR